MTTETNKTWNPLLISLNVLLVLTFITNLINMSAIKSNTNDINTIGTYYDDATEVINTNTENVSALYNDYNNHTHN